MTGVTPTEFQNEAEVEQRFIYPLLTQAHMLGIPGEAIKPKTYLAPTTLDKKAGKNSGYYPDYSIWILGNPILIIEAKDPTVPSETGFREACLYARHLNSRYPTDFNPCKYVISTNGTLLLAGFWDQETPILSIDVSDLLPGSISAEGLTKFCGYAALEGHAKTYFEKIKINKGIRPFNKVGGQALLNSKKPLNSFAAELSPVLKRYFSSANDKNITEIVERAYVSSPETTEYDRVLEALLRERTAPKKDTIVESLVVQKNQEPLLTRAITEYSQHDKKVGHLQIIQGGVGSGKSLFARRYRTLLEPLELKSENFWSFVDFNGSPTSLIGAELWLCEAFIASFQEENPAPDLYDPAIQKGIFSKRIQQRRAYYEQLRSISASDETRARAEDIAKWQDDYAQLSEGLANYIVGITGKNLVVVLDNVDKLDLENQLAAFQLALWFMQRTKAFVIIQMRDETYERYKNKPPLDTYRTGITFHISPPRFIDVVKRRLELAIEFLNQNYPERQEYTLENGYRIILPRGELGNFLLVLYKLLFERRSNVAKVLEALAGRDVRRALEMFVSIVTSGHLSPIAITSNVKGAGDSRITEHHILRILMRTDYRFFSDNSGYISNIFFYENSWIKGDNFILIEVLYFLSLNRKKPGDIGLEGYFCVQTICQELGKIGYVSSDILGAVNYLLNRQLIMADHFNYSNVSLSDSIKIQAAGFIHLRILCERVEYLYGILPVIPIADEDVCNKISDYVNRENQRGEALPSEKVRAIEVLHNYLKYELSRLHERNPFFDEKTSGAAYVLKAVGRCIRSYYSSSVNASPEQDALDLI